MRQVDGRGWERTERKIWAADSLSSVFMDVALLGCFLYILLLRGLAGPLLIPPPLLYSLVLVDLQIVFLVQRNGRECRYRPSYRPLL